MPRYRFDLGIEDVVVKHGLELDLLNDQSALEEARASARELVAEAVRHNTNARDKAVCYWIERARITFPRLGYLATVAAVESIAQPDATKCVHVKHALHTKRGVNLIFQYE